MKVLGAMVIFAALAYSIAVGQWVWVLFLGVVWFACFPSPGKAVAGFFVIGFFWVMLAGFLDLKGVGSFKELAAPIGQMVVTLWGFVLQFIILPGIAVLAGWGLWKNREPLLRGANWLRETILHKLS